MTDLKNLSNEELITMLCKIGDMNVLQEIARRINEGLIPLAMVGFSKLSNKQLASLDNLIFENCDWALKEILKRMKEGKIPKGKAVTMEEVSDMYRRAREAKA